MISSILSNLGIAHQLRVTKYPKENEPDPDFQHIYVVVPSPVSTIIIDPVTDEFDYEVPFLDKKDIPMKLEILNGLDGNSQQPMNGVDFEDLFAQDGYGLSGKRSKQERAEQVASSQGMSVAQMRDHRRAEFIKKFGMSPEEWKKKEQVAFENRPGLVATRLFGGHEENLCQSVKNGGSFPSTRKSQRK